ncbi:hypothetical protein [Aestuariimicrobium sp. Y1814]|uniref:hypothetical protein n=1 Tax=Aestuariimicrobium sp. Y1814 TaxID=3418742 RepID=UPI003DA7229C
MSTLTAPAPALIPPALGDVLRQLAADAREVDTAGVPVAPKLRDLGEAGLLDQGIDDLLAGRADASDLRASVATIAALAGECLSTGFSAWAHRVVVDYLARGTHSPATAELLSALRHGEVAGATGMAQALKSLAGLGELGITATPTGDGGWVLDGQVTWISNQVPGAVLVLPAATPDGNGLVVWVRHGDDGLAPRHIEGLLALDATASGSLRLEAVKVGSEQVLSTDLAGFVREVKPTFLVLQTAFAAGLIERSWAEVEPALDRPENSVFGAQARDLGERISEFRARLQRLAADVSSAPVRDYLQLRLDASHLAQEATRLELTLAGGRGYLVNSGANRRFREAAFLPVQSPSEGHLRWELSSLA